MGERFKNDALTVIHNGKTEGDGARGNGTNRVFEPHNNTTAVITLTDSTWDKFEAETSDRYDCFSDHPFEPQVIEVLVGGDRFVFRSENSKPSISQGGENDG